ncbi:MAG: menaquinone biosynthesis protein [Bacteroidales bacterium]|nr:menaquinone biosynthesis protein [Bacteroidales bacterium]MCB9013670.1 menaquinone biosynthesis protein [Bacteroidales bacterium]
MTNNINENPLIKKLLLIFVAKFREDMSMIPVSAVKYTNSLPFIYGLQNHSIEQEISLSLDTPAQCYNNLLCGQADIGLVPVVFKNHTSSIFQVSDYGIGARGKVLSVILVSSCPLEEIKSIELDYQSRTSVLLTRLLCRDFWNINPEFRQAKAGYESHIPSGSEASLIIGDRSFPFNKQKELVITDLAEEWQKFSGLPFVFAIWASIKKLSPEFEKRFSSALAYGISQKHILARDLANAPEYKNIDLHHYLHNNIIHEISQDMSEGMNLFLHLIRDIRN